MAGKDAEPRVKQVLLEKMAGEVTLSDAAGQTLRKWRETFEVSQSELAEHLGINPSVVSDYESGRRKSPGIATVKRLVEALITIDEARGGHIIARYHSLINPAEGILDIAEYPRSVPAEELVEAIDGTVLSEGNLSERRVQGFTLIDAVRAIASLNATDYVRVYGWSSERALCFSGIKYGRSPMVAIRVHPMKPSLVVYHRPERVDHLAHKLAEFEQIPLVTTDLGLEDFNKRLRRLGEAATTAD